MAEETNTGSAGMKPWLRIVLVLSLALNLLIVGVAAGAMVKWSKWKSDPRPRAEMGIGPLTRALSPEDRRAIGKEMRKAHQDGRLTQRDHRAELAGLIADLKAMPYDPAPVERRLAGHRTAFAERFDLGLSLLQARLIQMSPDERAGFAERLQRALDKRHSGKGKSGKEE